MSQETEAHQVYYFSRDTLIGLVVGAYFGWVFQEDIIKYALIGTGLGASVGVLQGQGAK